MGALSDRLSFDLLGLAGSLVSPGGKGARLSILMYHRVLRQKDPLLPTEVDATEFERQIGALRRSFNVLPLGEAVARLRKGSLPSRAACITFDDGYADNAEVALPILQRHGLPATFFIATGFLDGGRMFNDTVIESVRRASGPEMDLSELGLGRHPVRNIAERRGAIKSLLSALKYLPHDERIRRAGEIGAAVEAPLPDDLMMRSSQVRELRQAGMEIGGHTVSHPILAGMEDAAARAEIAGGREALERLLGEPVDLFAYPNGKPGQDYRAEHARMVREAGFTAAVSTAWGAARMASDCYQLPRFTPWDKSPRRFVLRLFQNCAGRQADVA